MCPFCEIPKDRIVEDTDQIFAIRDGFPVTDLHTLIIPKRHVKSFFELTSDEKQSVLKVLENQKLKIEKMDSSVTSFNIGINDGPDAGQTIPHCHVHLIPRRESDIDDPRGGVRGVIPDKQQY